MNQERAFDAFALHDAADDERLPHAASFAGDHNARENLDAFLFAFKNALVDVDLIADVESAGVFLHLRLFDDLHKLRLHWAPRVSIRIIDFVGSIARAAIARWPRDRRSAEFPALPCRETPAVACIGDTPAAPARYAIRP